jgi:hypothetical protein
MHEEHEDLEGHEDEVTKRRGHEERIAKITTRHVV